MFYFVRQFFIFTLYFFSFTQKSVASPSVVVSIKPIHSLVCAVMKGAGKPTLLMDGIVSPHIYALKPGEVNRLEQATFIIWVGPSYETVLQKKMAVLKDQKKVLTLMEKDGLVLYTNRTGELWGGEAPPSCEDTHEHNRDYELDGHIWLAPNNARLIVAAVAKELASMDPVNSSLYEKNALETIQKIDELTQDILRMIEPVKKGGYLVFHDATQYFDRYFGTLAMGAIVKEPDLPPTALHLKKITEYLKIEENVCLFSEPQFDNKLVKQIARDTGQCVYQLDYLGTDLEADEHMYFELMRRFANSLVKGLSGHTLGKTVPSDTKNCCRVIS